MGVPIFQEQVIKLAMVAAGFTGGEADQLRRAMASWKKNGKLFQFKAKLINGMKERGYQVAFAEQIFNQSPWKFDGISLFRQNIRIVSVIRPYWVKFPPT